MNQDKDIYLKQTTVGPHRDDISFIVNDIDIRKLPYDIQINYSMFRRTYFLREYKVEDLMMFFNDRNKEDKDND